MPALSTIMPRRLWDALAAKYSFLLPVYPATHVYIHHGGAFAPLHLKDADGDGIPDNEESIWRGYQRHHMTSRGWSDIAYNFGVGLSGTVLEGRGWRRQGGATGSPDDRFSLSICAIGNFETQTPSKEMIDAIVLWIITGIEKGHIAPNAKIVGHKDKPYSTSCPGKNLYRHLLEIRSRVAHRRTNMEEVVEGPISEWYKHINDAPDGTQDEAMRVWQYALWLQDELDITEIDGVKGPETRAANERWEAKRFGPTNANGKPGKVAWPILLQGPPPETVEVTVTEVVPVVPDGVAEAVDEAVVAASKAKFIISLNKKADQA